jgi:predicted phosphate transport protein (TIGR00153 family)
MTLAIYRGTAAAYAARTLTHEIPPMMSWFQALMPKEHRYFDLFERHAATLVLGAEALNELLKGGPRTPEYCAAVAKHENDADDITREVMTLVRQTFITPFDRSDIIDLVSLMDDAIDQMHKTAKATALFDQRTFQPDMQRLGEVIVKTAALTAEAVPLLRAMKNNHAKLAAITDQVTRLEEESDHLYDAGLAALYRDVGKKDPMQYIVGAEIYDHLEKVVDRFEDVANRISGVLIEHL